MKLGQFLWYRFLYLFCSLCTKHKRSILVPSQLFRSFARHERWRGNLCLVLCRKIRGTISWRPWWVYWDHNWNSVPPSGTLDQVLRITGTHNWDHGFNIVEGPWWVYWDHNWNSVPPSGTLDQVLRITGTHNWDQGFNIVETLMGLLRPQLE